MPASAPPAGALSLNAGTLATTASFASARAVTLAENGGTFATASATQLTLGRRHRRTRSARQDRRRHAHPDRRQQPMQAAPAIAAGVLQVASDANLGAATAPLVLDGGTLRFAASFDPAATRPVTLGAAGGTIDTGGNTTIFAQGITGTGALTKIGAGTLTLTGANSYAGGTTIAAGTLQIGNGGTTGSLTGNVVDNASLVFNRSNSATFGGIDQRHRIADPGRHRHHRPHRQPTATPAAPRSPPAPSRSATAAPPAASPAMSSTTARSRSTAPMPSTFAGTISGTGAVLQAGTGTTDPDRRQQLYRRHHDRCRHAADRRRRDQPAASPAMSPTMARWCSTGRTRSPSPAWSAAPARSPRSAPAR